MVITAGAPLDPTDRQCRDCWLWLRSRRQRVRGHASLMEGEERVLSTADLSSSWAARIVRKWSSAGLVEGEMLHRVDARLQQLQGSSHRCSQCRLIAIRNGLRRDARESGMPLPCSYYFIDFNLGVIGLALPIVKMRPFMQLLPTAISTQDLTIWRDSCCQITTYRSPYRELSKLRREPPLIEACSQRKHSSRADARLKMPPKSPCNLGV